MKTYPNSLFLFLSLFLFACHSDTKQQIAKTAKDTVIGAEQSTTPVKSSPADAKTILSRKEVPVLCYHQIRDWKASDSQRAHDDIIPPANFRDHMKMLADSGYHTILLDQLYDYLNNGTPLPSKPILLTFDDTDLDQYTIAEPTMRKYGFKGAFFVMTVSLGRPNYMSKAQVKDLSDKGNDIGSHTWDHHNVKKYQGKDWEIQIDKPTKTLQEITGKNIHHFAYPFGLWNPEAIPELKKRGFKSAFILSTKRDEKDPLFTIRRIIASGYWTPKTLSNSIKNSF